ncbi:MULTISPECIES: hypothetical protein [Thermoanaerobacter]|jgi:hypothetical protein|uniref:Uncharacterized protein n=2 Tax=Thermoanaerobacter TaxID=1754 RepID=B0KCD4_THEP3|nr:MULTISPECIES: hypothetical protein [Thermoanaerobacter]ABY95488.1 hypothetical protein Teth39_1853 [Thermoanaerobacter pseudethanolicus ATCC 33223]ADV80430.1 hypothetical protein Thebr_1901 [Thermoanaerobacter brockii subsp. finnii Ako-1]HBW60737.1 hypothetical protein [Thermoanaerobacter sp.]
MNEVINKMDIYIQKELKEKTVRILFLTFLLFIPVILIKTIALLFLSATFIVYDIRHQNAELLYFLPFSKKELFLYNLIFLSLVVIVTSAIGEIFLGVPFINKFEPILRSLILLLAIFGLQMAFSGFEMDGLGWSAFVVILDALLGNIGTTDINSFAFNPYSLISFTRQGNLLLSLIYSSLICLLGFWSYVIKGGEN